MVSGADFLLVVLCVHAIGNVALAGFGVFGYLRSAVLSDGDLGIALFLTVGAIVCGLVCTVGIACLCCYLDQNQPSQKTEYVYLHWIPLSVFSAFHVALGIYGVFCYVHLTSSLSDKWNVAYQNDRNALGELQKLFLCCGYFDNDDAYKVLPCPTASSAMQGCSSRILDRITLPLDMIAFTSLALAILGIIILIVSITQYRRKDDGKKLSVAGLENFGEYLSSRPTKSSEPSTSSIYQPPRVSVRDEIAVDRYNYERNRWYAGECDYLGRTPAGTLI